MRRAKYSPTDSSSSTHPFFFLLWTLVTLPFYGLICLAVLVTTSRKRSSSIFVRKTQKKEGGRESERERERKGESEQEGDGRSESARGEGRARAYT